jgi:hypothetical protein
MELINPSGVIRPVVGHMELTLQGLLDLPWVTWN